MESKVQYANNPPTYAPPAPAPYPAPAPAAGPGPSGFQQHQQPLSPQYPPQAQPPYPGQVPYGQPPAGYPPGHAGTPQYVGSPAPPAQQQQQVIVVSAGPQYQPVTVQHLQSYTGHIIFACFVAWCCNCLFGLIAFILAMVASSSAVSDPAGARRLGVASIVMSVVGIAITVLVVIIIASVLPTLPTYCNYTVYGSCYSYRTYAGYSSYCSGERYLSYCYYN